MLPCVHIFQGFSGWLQSPLLALSWPHFASFLASLGLILAPSWPLLASSWPHFGLILALLAVLGALLASSWPCLGPLSCTWPHLGSLGSLGFLGAFLGFHWGSLWVLLGLSWALLGITYRSSTNNSSNSSGSESSSGRFGPSTTYGQYIWVWDGAVHMIIISVIVSSDFRGNQRIDNIIEIMQRRSCVTIIIIIMHMISLLSDFGVGRHQP